MDRKVKESTSKLKCFICDKLVKPAHKGIECKVCEESFHPGCAKLNDEAIEAVLKHKLNWHCDHCKDEFSSYKNKIEELNVQIDQLKLRNDSLKTEIDSLNKGFEGFEESKGDMLSLINKKVDTLIKNQEMSLTIQTSEKGPVFPANDTGGANSYAAMAKKNNTLIIKPRSEEFISRGDVNKALKAVEVENSRVTPKGCYVLNFASQEKLDKAKASLSGPAFEDKFVAHLPKKLDPKITLCNIPIDVSEDAIVTSILEKNNLIEELIKNGEKFDLLFSKPAAGNTKHYIFKCSPKLRKTIFDNGGYIYLDLGRYRVYDRYHVLQCYHCQGFGHLAKNCESAKQNIPRNCGKCCEDHKTEECLSLNLKCSNCVKAGKENVNHRSRDDACPLYNNERKRIINNTDHGY